MIEKVDALRNLISVSGLLSYQEEEYYYIMSENSTDTFILLQNEDEKLIVWSYDAKIIELGMLIKYIEQIFVSNVIFPFVENEDDIKILELNGYKRIEFYADDIDQEQKKYPSYMKGV